MSKQLVAVYGSLKKGFHNHHILEKSKKVSEEEVIGWDMYSLGGFPAIVPSKFPNKVFVEVYSVDNTTMQSLDRLEGYPNFYSRTLVDTKKGKAWIYYLTYKPNDNKVDGGVWKL